MSTITTNIGVRRTSQSHALSADDYPLFMRATQPIADLGEAFDRDLGAIDRQLQPRAYAERRAALIARNLQAFDALVARTVPPLQEEVTAARAAALAGLVKRYDDNGVELPGWVRPTVEKTITPLDEARHQEIRTLLRAMPPHERERLYEQRAADGTDPELVLAVERSPQAFALVSTPVLARVQEGKIDRSPTGPRVRSLEAVLAAVRVFVDATRAELTAFGQVEAQGRA